MKFFAGGSDTFNTGRLPEMEVGAGHWNMAQGLASRRSCSSARLLVLLHELGVEHPEFLHHQLQFLRLREDGAAEMIGTGFLSKSTARNNAYS